MQLEPVDLACDGITLWIQTDQFFNTATPGRFPVLRCSLRTLAPDLEYLLCCLAVQSGYSQSNLMLWLCLLLHL